MVLLDSGSVSSNFKKKRGKYLQCEGKEGGIFKTLPAATQFALLNLALLLRCQQVLLSFTEVAFITILQ